MYLKHKNMQYKNIHRIEKFKNIQEPKVENHTFSFSRTIQDQIKFKNIQEHSRISKTSGHLGPNMKNINQAKNVEIPLEIVIIDLLSNVNHDFPAAYSQSKLCSNVLILCPISFSYNFRITI